MVRRLAPLLVLAALLPSLPARAQTNYIALGNFTAHPTRILAKFKDGNVSRLAGDTVRQLGSRVHRRFQLVPGLAVLEEADTLGLATVAAGDESARRTRLLSRIDALQKSGLFEYVEPDYIVHTEVAPTDTAFVNGTLWGLRNYGQDGGLAGADISATNAWSITTGSTNVIVAVIDTGIRYSHNELFTQLWHNPGEIAGNGRDDDGDGYVDDVFGINAITGSGDPFDDNSHGTHVSGTIGAAANDGNPHVGVTWKVQLMGCKFLSAGGFGSTSDALTCIDFAVNKGAKILNNSWGGGAYEQSLFDAIDRARAKGVLFVVAAQNSGLNNDVNPAYPANYQLNNILAVAALDRSDNLASFSNYGQSTVHLGAPGVHIFSSTAGSDSDYQFYDGTSQATPHVSGVAALILSQYPGADLEEVRGRILAGVVPIPSLSGKTITGGRLNAYNSLTATGSGILQIGVTPPSGSAVLRSAPQAIFVTVKDLFGVTNATVTGSIAGLTNLVFANAGAPPDALAGDSTYSAFLQVPAATGNLTMTLSVSAPGKVSATNVVVYTVVVPPANDNFVNATKVPIAGASYLSNNKFATLEPSEPFHAGITNGVNSLWWVWSTTSDTDLLVDATGSSIDAIVAVYTGTDLAALQPVASAVGSVAQKKPAHVNISARAGVSYHIAVASNGTNSVGSIRLRVAPGGHLDISPPSVFVAAPTNGTTFNSKLIVVGGTAFDSPPDASGVVEVLVKVNNGIASPANGTANWTSSALLQPGVNTIQAVGVDAAGNISAPTTVQVSYVPIGAPNDLFVNAIALTGAAGTNTVNTGLATKEPGEALTLAGNAGGKSVWWSYTPASDGVLTVSTTNSAFDTLMVLYTTNAAAARADITSLVEVASNDDALPDVTFSKIAQAVSANRTYWIVVDGFDGASGVARLTYSFVPGAIFHLNIATDQSGSVDPGSGAFASGSTVVLTATPGLNYNFTGWTGDVTSSVNPLSVVVNSDLNLTARFEPRPYSDDFESGGFSKLPWVLGDGPWTVQTDVVSFGRYAARSGAISDGQHSRLSLTEVTAAGSGSFDFKISSETNWDRLEFSVNGVTQQRWSGEVGWATYQFTLAAGTNVLEWTYTKDPVDSSGLDAAFIDNVDLPLAAAGLFRLSPTSTGFQVQYLGQGTQTVRIQASTDLASWQTVTTYTIPAGATVQFVDPQGLSKPRRFYRALAP